MEFVSADPIRGPPNVPQNGPAPDTAMQKTRLENPRAEKRAQNWGRLPAPPVHIFCSHGPVSGSARWTPKWGRPGHGDSKNLAWASPKIKAGPKLEPPGGPNSGAAKPAANSTKGMPRQNQYKTLLLMLYEFSRAKLKQNKKPKVVQNMLISRKTHFCRLLPGSSKCTKCNGI